MTDDNLKRLGQLVQARRIAQGWKTREGFADQLSFSYRVLTDLENGNRKLGSASYREIENKLEWRAGSVDKILQGGDPERLSDVDTRLRSQVIHPSKSVKLYAAAEESEDVARLLMDIIENRIDDETRAKALDLFDDITIRDFPAQFEKLSRQGKVRVARYAGRVLLEEQNPTQEEDDDISTEPTSASGTGETPESQKNEAADRRNEDDLIEPDPASGVDADDAQSDVDLAGGWRRGGGKSEGRLRREQQDRDAESE
ncbi:hypothetical protein JTZ10_21465 [Gordonia rubripertincta]|uniref:HTH cro/C1-type domain-containing protein n=1 Tax=Gordonia rubripertincta TaxID=36822 RepID=A0AAW4GBI8_GORRU|nr:hypothetical protein [Gordonia rubripertincta]MBM7280316.1 hypothetical protein [Gordonia rubripertincta]QMU19306.1 hypothetical protein H3V45_14515 [Gordonia rubripertincta]